MPQLRNHIDTFPLEHLFRRMELAGFVLSPADRLRALQVLGGPGKSCLQQPQRLRELLAPVLVRSEAEQQKFYEIFDQYYHDLAAPVDWDALAPRRPLHSYWRWLLLLAVVALLGYGYYKISTRRPVAEELAVFIDGPTSGSPGDTIRWNNQSRFSGDTTQLRWRWSYVNPATGQAEATDSTQYNWTFIVPPIDSGTYIRDVTLSVYHQGLDSTFEARQGFAVFCSTPPAVLGIGGEKQLEAGQQANFSLLADEKDFQVVGDKVIGKAASWRYEWDFGDGQPTKGSYAASHTFEKNGQYTVQLTVTDTSQAAYCATVVMLDVKVGIEQAFLPFAQLHEDELKRLAVWGLGYYLLLGLLGAGLVFHWVRWIVLRRRDRDDDADTSPADKALHARFAHSDKAPYYIPIQEQRGKILFSPAQVRLADALRLRQTGIRREIDVPKTLQSTIDLGGFPAVRFKYLTQPSEYLCLIDEQSRNDHQARLFRHIADNLRAQDVHLEVFYYRRQLTRCWNATHPLGLTLDQLHRHYGQHKLIVMGDLHDLVDPHALEVPALRPVAANTLRQWRQRLLLTPVPPVSWGYREKLIARVFSIFPADTQGLSAAALHLENDGELLPDGYAFDRWKTNQAATRQDAETEHRNWRRWRDIQTYLAAYGSDVERWFRALAVFPLPTWELTVAIGHELGIPVTLDKLLILARVPVMQAEKWDERLRQDMLAGLNPSDEHTARYVVQRELQAVKVITAGSHAHHDLETALAIQDFALNPYGEDERTAIRFLLDSGQLSPAQEAELGQVVNKTSPARRTKGNMSKVAEETPKLNLAEWLAKDETAADKAPEAPVANPSTWDMRLAAFLTLAYIVMLLVGWQLGGTPQLYKWVFGDEQPASNRQPMRDYFLVKETTVVDSVIILNNMGVSQAQVGGYSDTTAASYFRSAMEKANPALYGYGHGFRGKPISYALANTNLSRLYYNHAAYFLQQYLRDSLGQAVLPEALEVLEKAYISDSVALDVLHARGVIHYYLGSPEDSMMAYYVPLDEEGYFDAIDYSPNLSTLLGRERSRILEASISEAGDQVLNLTVNYYVDNTIDKETYLYMFTEGKGELPLPQELAQKNASRSAVFRIEPPRKNPGTSTAFYVQLRRRASGAIIDSREIVYDHNWAIPKIRDGKTAPNAQTPRTPTTTRPPVDRPPQVQKQTYRIYGQVVDMTSRKPLSGVSIRMTDGSATTQTDGEGRFTLELQAEPSDNAARTLAATLDGFSSYSSQYSGVQWMEQTQKEPLDIRLWREVPRPAMRAVGAGSFARPLDDGFGGKRKPEMQTVSVGAFSMATYELTFAEYDLFCEATGRSKPDDQGWGRRNRPVMGVTWVDAVTYCNWLSEQHEYSAYYNISAGDKGGVPRVSVNAGANGYRLPTEAEWEYAARGGTRQQDPDAPYAGGDTKTPLSQLGWFDDNSNGRTQPVGQLRANNSGLYDMSGNVWEWCWDIYGDYSRDANRNPTGPTEGSHRIIRGGAWIQQADDCRVHVRQYRRPEEQTIYMGFRLARTP